MPTSIVVLTNGLTEEALMISTLCPETSKEQLRSGDLSSGLSKLRRAIFNLGPPITGARYDIEMWFDDEFKLSWMR